MSLAPPPPAHSSSEGAGPERQGTAPSGAPASAAGRRRRGTFATIQAVRDNPLELYTEESFRAPIRTGRLLFQNFVTVNTPALIEEVLLTRQDEFPKGPLARSVLGPVLGDGLLISEGETWRRHRRIAAPAFAHRALADLAPIMVQATEETAARWAAGEAVDVRDIMGEMMALTMTVVARTLFSRELGVSIDRLARAMTVVLDSFGRPSPLDLIGAPSWVPRFASPRGRAAVAALDGFIFDLIRQRRADPDAAGRRDLLAMLLEARDAETGLGLNDRQLRDEIVTLFAAGHETTAVALTWTWYLLSQHPQIEAALHDELDGVLSGRAPQLADVDHLPLTRQVIDEALRLYPPAFSLTRVAGHDLELGGLAIQAGTLVTVSPWLTHHNPELWPDPWRFDPARFAPGTEKARPRFAYFPFGGGPRVCIGAGFALMEARLILALLASRFRLSLVPGHEVKPLGRVTLRPRYGMRMEIRPRGHGPARPAS